MGLHSTHRSHHFEKMKTAIKSLVILQALFLLVIVWYIWILQYKTKQHIPYTRKEQPRPVVNAFRSISLTVGKDSTLFKYKLYKPGELNNATVLTNGCKPTQHTDEKIELITGYIDFVRNKKYRQSIGELSRETQSNNEMIEARQMEIIDVLQSNLLHPAIQNIHVMVWDNETAKYLNSLALQGSEKLILRVIGKDVGLTEQLLYASECLADRVIAITNQDNKIGKGWNNTEYHRILKQHDILYALTRHSPVESNCTWLYGELTCNDGVKYVGCHDTFVLRAKRWERNQFKDIISVTPDKLGMENLFLWFFKEKLKYSVINPCKVLFVHHHHCVAIRGVNRPRINTGGRSVLSPFTDKLV